MIAKFLSLPVALVLAGTAAPQPLEGEKPVTKMYDVSRLLNEMAKTQKAPDADAVIKLLFEAIPQLRPGEIDADGPRVIERENGQLEVSAPADLHAEIKDLLAALERLHDLTIDVKTEVIELDTAAFEKYQKALPKVGRGKAGSPVAFVTGEGFEENRPGAAEQKALEDANKILKAGRVVQTSSGRFANGRESTLAARLTASNFSNAGGNADTAQFVKEGFKLTGLPIASADRRSMRLKLTEQSVAFVRVKRAAVGEVGGQPIVAQATETEDLGATGSTVVADGGAAIFRLAYAPKDKVWVVVVKPKIIVPAEEAEPKNGG